MQDRRAVVRREDAAGRDLEHVLHRQRSASTWAREVEARRGAYLDGRVVQVGLRVREGQVLREHHLRALPAPGDDVRLDMHAVRRGQCDIEVAARARAPGRRRARERGDVVDRDVPRRARVRRVEQDLEEARDEPVLVDRVVRFGGGDVERDVVRRAVREDGDEGREVQEVRREVERTVGRDRPASESLGHGAKRWTGKRRRLTSMRWV